MRIAYVAAELPYGKNEPFVIPEIVELERQACEVSIVPVWPKGRITHGDAQALLPKAVLMPLCSPRILWSVLLETVRAPVVVGRALALLRQSRSTSILLKNLCVFPKGIWLGRHARDRKVQHIHAHWGGTTATMAMIASEASGIPWSMTAHRWDIREDNLLAVKARHASFIRVINELGAENLRRASKDPSWQPWVLHLGVRLPGRELVEGLPEPPLRAVMAANFLEIKGHSYLIDALGELKARGIGVQLDLAGDGPLESEIHRRVEVRGLDDCVKFLGRVPHEKLLIEMASGRWHVAVLPSITTPDGEHEGIPVFLIEAMACGIAVIATATGGIPELIGEGTGLLVPPRSHQALAGALESLVGRPDLRCELGREGRIRVEEAFSVEAIVTALRTRFASSARAASPALGSDGRGFTGHVG